MQTLIELESQWNSQGFAVIDNFLTQETIGNLRELANHWADQGAFQPAKVGLKDESSRIKEIRGDSTLWVDPQFSSPALDIYLNSMAALKDYFNQWLFAGLVDLECHFARYPAGAFYQKHYDRFKGQDTRTISTVLYLNPPDWKNEDQGFLAVYPESAQKVKQEVLPVGGRLVLFDSATLLHEVLPATRTRWSLTGWFLRRDYSKLDLGVGSLDQANPQFEMGSLWGAPIKPQGPSIPPRVA